MYYLKTKEFVKWAKKEGFAAESINKGISEFLAGLYDADLGNSLYKKRIPLKGKGKRSGGRSIIFYQSGKVFIFCFGYPKSEQGNLTKDQKVRMDILSAFFQKMKKGDIENAIKSGNFVEVQYEEH